MSGVGKVELLGGSDSYVTAALRQKDGYDVREEVARTLTNPAELEEEIRYLLSALSPS